MLILNKTVDPDMSASNTVMLSYEQRQRSKLRVNLGDGQDAGINLPRGNPMQPGDKLSSACGQIVEVLAGVELVSTACVDDPLLFARACYHLGNRHVKLQIEKLSLSYRHDHVLDGLLNSLGIKVIVEERPFEPESGAYSGGHSHNHDHDHDHEHRHGHAREHGHAH